MTYQVMLGAPTEAIESTLTAGFEELADSQIVSVHRSSKEIIDTVPKLANLDVVLIHEELGPLPVLDIIRELSRSHPQLAVILLVEEVLPDTFNQAMEAGARGVLATSATVEELSARISTAADWSRTLRRHLEAASLDIPVSGSRGSVVALSGSKGGIGTTTAAIQLAMAAAKAKRSVCLVDLDLQSGDIPSFMDLTHRRSIVDLAEVADNISAAMLSDTLYVHPDGIHILLAPGEGERGEDMTASAARQILGALRSRYEVVIVDCGAYMTEASAMAVELADTAIVVVSPDLPAIRGGQRLVAMWERLQIRKKDEVTALLTRHSRKNEIQPDFVRKLLGTPLFKHVIPANYRALEEATNTGDPLRISDDGLRKAFRLVADEVGLLITRASETEEPNSDDQKAGSKKTSLSGLLKRDST
ncbi:AAA family ATPase [Nocardiopsis rhodophaea]|uniref:AAA family ATPase n=1 Tax=Nocardiopsis rhodophaea TaxID=280238 RepID=UPI0031E04EA2